MRALALTILLAACHGGSSAPAKPATPAPATPTATPAPTPMKPEPEPIPRSTPAPKIGWSGSFDIHGFPMIAAAGEIVVVPIIETTEHSRPNLRLEVRGADDHVIETLSVVSLAESDTLLPNEKSTPALVDRIAGINAKLATLHGVHDLRAMDVIPVEPAHGGEAPHWASGDNLDIEWREHHLRVFRHNVTQPLADRDGTHWIVPAGTCKGGYTPFLSAVYHVNPDSHVVAAGNTVVIEIGYHADDGCAEVANQAHVISWVGAK